MFACGPALFRSPRPVAIVGGGGDPYFANVVLLAHMEDTSFVDVKGHTRSTTGSPTAPAGDTGFGNCIDFPSGTNYIQYADAANDYDLGTGDWTIEFKIYPTRVGTNTEVCFDLSGGAVGVGAPIIYWFGAGGQLRIHWDGTDKVVANFSLTNNAWNSVAASRQGSNVSVFKNGVSGALLTTAVLDVTNGRPRLGAQSDAAAPLIGKMDEVRITKGVCRYVPATAGSNVYTPATAPFPDF